MQSLKSGCFHHFQNQASEGCTMHMITTPAFGCGPKSGRCSFLDPGIRIYWQDPSLHEPPSLSLPLSAAAPRTTTKNVPHRRCLAPTDPNVTMYHACRHGLNRGGLCPGGQG